MCGKGKLTGETLVATLARALEGLNKKRTKLGKARQVAEQLVEENGFSLRPISPALFDLLGEGRANALIEQQEKVDLLAGNLYSSPVHGYYCDGAGSPLPKVLVIALAPFGFAVGHGIRGLKGARIREWCQGGHSSS